MSRARTNANNWAADITEVQAGTGISVTNGTGPAPTVTNSMATAIDAKGDLVVGSGADAFVRVPIGANNQVLTADSATTSGVKWAAPDPLTTKGDLFTFSTTEDRLPVGANGETLVADSSTSTGLRYIPYGSNNFAINGAMDFWQRGTSFSVSAFNQTYTADRWSTFNANAVTISQETSIVPEGARYALKITGGATTSGYEVVQALETSDTLRLAGKTITVSLMVAGTASKNHTITIDSSTSTDNGVWGTWSGISPAGSVTTAASNAYSQLRTTVTVPTTAKSLRIRFSTDSLTSGQVAYISLVQLEIGSTATPFRRSGGTLAGELAACQRYFYQLTGANGSGGIAEPLGLGTYYNASIFRLPMRMPVAMRTAPAFTASNVANYFSLIGNGVSLGYPTVTLDIATTNSVILNVATTGGTTGQAAWVQTANAASFVSLSAEL